ncbi:hypothetical protein K488DRAFT_73604 [Vararia minispora EC-137]|uniref:Uncharacterized protein n=1 Tax=Vararia minispora EC-137 TaxID=1314806 RepID=A0ACB8QA80_9AGAM|nr:hypothetical protein K488DRAFT_73604 [Vararia minispora EC-137]
MSSLSIIARSASRSAPRASRALHASPRASIAAGNSRDRLPAGVDPDNYVPPFYVERKRHRDAIADRKDMEGGLMYELSAGVLSDEVAATTRRLHNKIPTEHRLPEGDIIHPSGFVVPTPGVASEPYADIRERDIQQQTNAVAARVNEDRALRDLTFGVRPRDEKVPYECVHADGTVAHPSGFVPPTPAHHFPSAPDVAPEGEVILRETSGPAARTPWKQG